MDGDLPLGFVTAHDKAVRPALSAILESAFAANRSFRVRRQTPEGLQDKKLKKKKRKMHVKKRKWILSEFIKYVSFDI